MKKEIKKPKILYRICIKCGKSQAYLRGKSLCKKCREKKEFKNYIVETGNYRKKIKGARTLTGAILSAFILYPPKNIAVLTRARLQIPNRKDPEGVWNYIDTKVMLKKAGYK